MPHSEHDSLSSTNGERGQSLYVQAARFADEERALVAYAQVQEAIFAPACDLSAYRFLLGTDSYVTVLGAQPPATLDAQLRAILDVGEPTALPDDVYQALVARREAAAREGQWVERHYRQGNSTRRPKR